MRKSAVFLALLIGLPVCAASLDQARERFEARDFVGAKSILESTVKIPTQEAGSVLLLTRVYNAEGDYENGVPSGKRAIKLLPQSSAAHLAYAEALRFKMTNAGAMKAMFTVGTYKKMLYKAIELDPQNVGAREEEIGFLIQAPSIAGGSKSKARERIADLEPIAWKTAKSMLARLELAEENFGAAESLLNEMIERDPNDFESRIRLGYLFQRQKKFEQADALFAELAENENRKVALAALYQRGRTRVLGEYEPDRAVELFRQYIAELPEDSGSGVAGRGAAYWRMGMAYELADRKEQARQAYEQALEIDPDDENARKALKALR